MHHSWRLAVTQGVRVDPGWENKCRRDPLCAEEVISQRVRSDSMDRVAPRIFRQSPWGCWVGLSAKVQGETDQASVCRNTQRSQNHHGVAASPKFMSMNAVIAHHRKELSIALGAAEQTDDQDTGAVDGEQRTNTVELGGEDFEDDQSKRELGERCPNVGTFKGSLGSTNLNNLI